MRLASDVLFVLALVWLLGAVLAVNTWARERGGRSPKGIEAKYDMRSFAAFAVFFALAALLARLW